MTDRPATSSPASTGPARARRLAAGFACLAVLTGACSGGGETDETGTEGDDLAFIAPTGDEAGQSEEAEAEGEPATTTTTAPSTTETMETTPTTAGSGLGPVTTVAVSAGGDPQGIYRGIIGNLDPDETVAAGALVAPTVGPSTLPLTGQPGIVPDRPAAVVKIDNGQAAHPQTGLNSADIVIEEEVEGGVTRFAAVFHSTPTIVGPVRSGRTTDVSLISGLGSPLLIYSGANQITEGIIRRQPGIQNRSHGSSSGYWRDNARRAPSNLYTDTAPHWASATGGPPPPQFSYRSNAELVTGAVDEELTVAYRSSTARWSWDGERWLRWQRGSEHRLANGQQVSAANVVVIEAEKVDTGMVDASGGAVPEFVFVGTGRATVFTDGKRIEGTWTRPTLTSVATLTHSPGRAIELTPGRTWVQLIEAGSGLLG